MDRDLLVVELLGALTDLGTALRARRGAAVIADWRTLVAEGWRGSRVRWQDGAVMAAGVVRDVDDDGALVVERDGVAVRVIAGEVLWDRLA